MDLRMMIALGVDLALGEPPLAVHPTVWMGRLLASGRRRAPVAPHARAHVHACALLGGAAVCAGGAAAVIAASYATQRLIARLPRGARDMAEGVISKPALSLRALLDAGSAVERALRVGDLDHARRLLGRHLVSRETRALSPAEIAGATIESLAENLSDGLVAPLLAYRVGGLPAAYAYRFLNTADAMLGYRTAELEYFGKAAARADDLANLLPARLTALAIALAAPAARGSVECALRCARRDARTTPSPNAGWPMAAMAGALGCRLAKRDGARTVYVLNAGGRSPAVRDIHRARRVVCAAGVLAAGVLAW